MRPYFRCRNCNKRLVPLVHRLGHYLCGRERICPRCGKIWRLPATSQQMLIAFGVVIGVISSVEARDLFPGPEGDMLVLVLWLPVYVFVVWPMLFGLLGNYRLK
jgi:hypothetical protein